MFRRANILVLSGATGALNNARDALEYVARVENSDCRDGTAEVLSLFFNHSAWEKYTGPAIKTANFLTELLSQSNNTMDQLSEEMMFSLVRNNVRGKSLIFGSAIAIEKGVYSKFETFCPYAYKKNGTVNAHDISTAYDYLDPDTEWYQQLRTKEWSNITLLQENIQYNYNSTMSAPPTQILVPRAELEDGHWTDPYFDCGGGDVWMVTYSSPIFGLTEVNASVIFKGVATIDIELTNIDINQCDQTKGEFGALDIFRGTHNCQQTTKCVPITGQGFRRGSYNCFCQDGYYHPQSVRGLHYYSGSVVEEFFSNSNNSKGTTRFDCMKCMRGCDTCIDDTPCMFPMNIATRIIVLLINTITIAGLVALQFFTFVMRANKVIKTASPVFLQLMCVGGIVMCLQIFVLFEEPNQTTCIIQMWFFHVGMVITFGSLILKTWSVIWSDMTNLTGYTEIVIYQLQFTQPMCPRCNLISQIFNNKAAKKINLPDKVILQRRFLPMMFCAVCYLAAWSAIKPPDASIHRTSSNLKFIHCSTNYMELIAYSAEACLLLYGVYLCFTVRKAPANFNESKHITWTTYNAIILGSFIVLAINFIAFPAGPDVLYALALAKLQVFVTITSLLIFVPKIWNIYKHNTIRDLDTINNVSGRGGIRTTLTVASLVKDKAVQTD